MHSRENPRQITPKWSNIFICTVEVLNTVNYSKQLLKTKLWIEDILYGVLFTGVLLPDVLWNGGYWCSTWPHPPASSPELCWSVPYQLCMNLDDVFTCSVASV